MQDPDNFFEEVKAGYDNFREHQALFHRFYGDFLIALNEEFSRFKAFDGKLFSVRSIGADLDLLWMGTLFHLRASEYRAEAPDDDRSKVLPQKVLAFRIVLFLRSTAVADIYHFVDGTIAATGVLGHHCGTTYTPEYFASTIVKKLGRFQSAHNTLNELRLTTFGKIDAELDEFAEENGTHPMGFRMIEEIDDER